MRKNQGRFLNSIGLNRIDITILAPAVLLVGISLLTLYSIDLVLFRQQLFFFIISIISYFIFMNIDYKLFGQYSKVIYVTILTSLLLLFFFGVEVNGSVSWFNIFGLHLQVSELSKPFFIIIIAWFLSTSKAGPTLKAFISVLILVPIFLLIAQQPDLGTSMVYFFTLALILLTFGFPLKTLAYFGALLAVLVPVAFLFLADYQKARFVAAFNISNDPEGSSYNIIQSLISIGSGGFLGKGLGEGTQSVLRFLPERHTDFMFASISENLGFIGGVSVVIIFSYLLYRIYSISLNVDLSYSRIIVIGAFFLFLVQMFLNIGMNIGIVPIIGITLPFVSYGGSSLLTSFILLGIVSSIQYEHKRKESLEIR